MGWGTGRLWRVGTKPKLEPKEVQECYWWRVCAAEVVDSFGKGPGELGNGAPVGGETPQGAGMRSLRVRPLQGSGPGCMRG